MAIHIDKNQPFHIASVGKSFTATLIGCLIDDDLIRLDDKINKYLHDTTIDDLFIVNDKDYKDDVIIRHLLNHPSGVANYFDDETSHALPMKNLILQDKEKRWTPQNLLSFIAIIKKQFHHQEKRTTTPIPVISFLDLSLNRYLKNHLIKCYR